MDHMPTHYVLQLLISRTILTRQFFMAIGITGRNNLSSLMVGHYVDLLGLVPNIKFHYILKIGEDNDLLGPVTTHCHES